MNEEWPVFEDFDSILIQNYIRFETAARHIRNLEAGQTEASTICRFQISPENYAKLQNCETSAPLLGLTISYNENQSILTAEPDDKFLETYQNAIMRDVALKQSENCKIRYSKFIKTAD